MPRYFFNANSDQYSPDRNGVLLAGPDEALSHAVVVAGEMLKEISGQFWGAAEWNLNVTDEDGSTVCSLTVKGTLGYRQ